MASIGGKSLLKAITKDPEIFGMMSVLGTISMIGGYQMGKNWTNNYDVNIESKKNPWNRKFIQSRYATTQELADNAIHPMNAHMAKVYFDKDQLNELKRKNIIQEL